MRGRSKKRAQCCSGNHCASDVWQHVREPAVARSGSALFKFDEQPDNDMSIDEPAIENATGMIKRYIKLTTVMPAKERANAHTVPRMGASVAAGPRSNAGMLPDARVQRRANEKVRAKANAPQLARLLQRDVIPPLTSQTSPEAPRASDGGSWGSRDQAAW